MLPFSYQPCAQVRRAVITVLTMELFRGLRDHASLIGGAGELIGARLAAPMGAGDGGGAVRRAAGDFVELHLAGKPVVQADHSHAEMKEVGDDREQRRLLATMLRACRG